MSVRWLRIACLVAGVLVWRPSAATPADAPVHPRFTLAGGATVWPAAADAWAYEDAFLGTALGSEGQVRHDGGWEARVATTVGRPAGGVDGLRVELCYGRDRLTLSEYLKPVHVGTARRYDMGALVRQRLTARLGTGFRVRGRLSLAASLGLVDAQFNRFRVAADDAELPFAVGGRLDVTASDATLLFNPLEVDLRLDAGSRLYGWAGMAYDRLEAPLEWSIAGAPQAAGARDQLSVAGAVFHLGAGVRW